MAENVENNGKAFIVDPNPIGNEVVPLEDLFIYVKFSAYPRSRTTYNGTDLSGKDQFVNFGVEDEVNFISTKIRYNKKGEIDKPKPQNTYATTDWTNISSFGETTSSGILEGFGIKSIDIKYNASLVPQVDITFTDVRGSALFDNLSNGGDISSPYSVFFRMPYPVFRLSVKGYYGQKIDYCLHMTNWTSSFDNSSGNFDITANFLGYQQAILNDLVIGNIIGVVNTEIGKNNLKEIYNKNRKPEERIQDIEPYKLDNFITNIASLPKDAELTKSNLKSFTDFETLKKKKFLLEQIQDFIGKPIIKDYNVNKVINNNKPYLKFSNDKNLVKTSKLSTNKTNLSDNTDYLSIRDFLILQPRKQGAFKQFIISLNDAVKQYVNFLKNTENSDDVFDSSTSQKNQINNNNNNIYLVGDENLIKSFGNLDSEENWKETYVTNFSKENGEIVFRKVELIFNEFQNSNSIYSLRKNVKGLDDSLNTNFEINNFISERENNTLTKPIFNSEEDECVVIDFRLQRSLLEANIKEIEKRIKEKEGKINEELNEELQKNFKKNKKINFKMRDSFEILMNNSQSMLKTIHDITKKSEESNPKQRNKVISSYDTDIPKSLTDIKNKFSVAFPSFYDDENKEIYIGSSDLQLDKSLFPEIDFIDDVYRNIVNKKKIISQITYDGNVSNSDKWFPINPIDYEENPYVNLNGINTEESLIKSLFKTFLTRICILKNYSIFSKNFINNLDTYAKYDALNAKNVIYNKNIKNVIINILKKYENSNDSDIIDVLKTNFETLEINNNNITIPNNLLKIGENNITFDYDDINAKFVDLNISDIVNNQKELFEEITNDNAYKRHIKNSKNNSLTGYKGTNNIKTTCLNETLLIKTKTNFDELTYDDINPEGKYINKTNFETQFFPNSVIFYEEDLVDSKLYTKQNDNYSRSFLCLSTLPFDYIKKGFLDILFPTKKYENARVVEIPELYLYYIGSLIWRFEIGNFFEIFRSVDFSVTNDSDKDYNNFYSSSNKYLNKFGSKLSIKEVDIEKELINLPSSVKKFFVDKFKEWTDKNFNDTFTGDFENLFRVLVNGEENNTDKERFRDIFLSSVNLIIYNVNIFKIEKDNDKLEINIGQLQNYIKKFRGEFGEEEFIEENEKPNNDTEDDNEIKLSLYQYFRNLNNKWVSDSDNGFNICGGNSISENLIDRFKFIDRGWNDIGDEVVLDLKSFVNTTSNLQNTVYSLISSVLRDNGFLLQILPNYINYKTTEGVAKIFKPQTVIDNNSTTGPIFCCVYANGNSKHLNISERVNSYVNDGFSFTNTEAPADIYRSDKRTKISENENFSLVAFKVAFGSQNQSIFKSVNLNQQEHKETAEYFKALADLIDKRGSTQRTYKGTNLLQLFNTRSYSCTVDSMGCMGIQPLMYFDLQNVPFFNGAYLITSVNHNITPNKMSTTFKGLRQSKFVVPIVKDVTTSLKIDLNEGFTVKPITFIPNNSNYNIGVLNPDDSFDFETNFRLSKFKDIGVVNPSITQELIDGFKSILLKKGIKTNAQVCMFITNVLTQSNLLNNKSYEWDITNLEPNKKDGETIIYGFTTNILNQRIDSINVYKPADINNEKYFNFQPIFSGITNIFSIGNNDTFYSYTPKNIPSQLNDKKFLNELEGDPYIFKPFGYLYIVGRKQYFDYQNSNNLLLAVLFRKFLEEKSNNELDSFDVATWVWKNVTDNNNNSSFQTIEIQNNNSKGKSSVFARTVEISQQLDGSNNIKKSFEIFEKVLQIFYFEGKPLIDYFSS